MFYISGIGGSQTPYTPADTTAVPQPGRTPIEPISGISPIRNADQLAADLPHREHSPKNPQLQSNNPYAHLDDPIPVRERATLASQIMTSPVITVPANSTVAYTWKLFHEKHFRHVPVVSDTGKLIGMVSDRDFLALGLDHVGRELTRAQQLASPVKDIMTINVLTSRPANEIRVIAKIMFTENISAMPVVDDDENLVGIITTNDILRTLVNRAPLELWT